MDKKFLLFLFIISILISGCTKQEAPAEELPDVVEDNLNEQQVGEEEPEPVVEEETLQFFEATLKYQGSYNGPLYATSEQIGNYEDKTTYMGNLKRNGVNFMIGMFAVFGKTTEETFVNHANLGYVADLVSKYPGMIVPFFGSGFGGEQLESLVRDQPDTWISMYNDVFDTSVNFVGEDFIQGIGEVETQEWSLKHNDPKIMKLVDLASKKNKHFMFHPVADKLDGVKDMIEKYPNTMFLIHLYREDLADGQQELIDLMKTHNNLFFSIDAAHIIHYDETDILYDYYDDYGSNAKSKFISTVNSNYDSILNDAISAYKPLVKAVPDKVMWGTEAGPSYSFDPEVYDVLIKVSREFIMKVTDDPEQQEALGYKNALRVFGPGVKLEKEVNIINSNSWPLCKLSDIDDLCGECGIGEEDEEVNPESESCENDCILKLKCKDPLDG